MKRILSLVLAFSLCLTFSLAAFAEEKAVSTTAPSTVSKAYVVMDVDSGQVLLEKNQNEKKYPASITKILTAAIALEVGDPKDQYVITADDVFSYHFPGTTYVALTHDEVVTVDQLLNASLLASANDAANCLGSYVATKLGRSALNAEGKESYVSGFVEILNEKLQELGCTGSHFTNAHGLHDENHYTTAYDMALILRYALNVPGFRDYFGAESYTMAPTNMQPESRSWGTQSGLFIPSNKYYYEGATGAKLGYTDDAGHTMASVVKRGDSELLCILLDCGQGNWADHRDSASLYDYCFDNFQKVTFSVEELKQRSIPIYKDNVIVEKAQVQPASDYSLQLHKSLSKSDVRSSSDAPGRFFDGESQTVNLRFSLSKSALKKVEGGMYTDLGSLRLQVKAVPLEEPKPSLGETLMAIGLKALKVLGIVFVVLVVVILLLRIYNVRRYRKIRERRRQRELQRRREEQNSRR